MFTSTQCTYITHYHFRLEVCLSHVTWFIHHKKGSTVGWWVGGWKTSAVTDNNVRHTGTHT